ncbi:sugar ABC transporter permease [Glycomyces sp. TRM65418]|uniref:carbohydrate ABC transporter permease n=1 Tax=Glycomyces sp. TRM65418 TaxID=2867006 RepID=UPI001D16C1A3|nr:sugar ABC transporter permease [Glycomyces sp. TRM65418]MCC3765375.1 sugar ABC transporter permease [Glycomyces sp. TRM65418]
MTATAIDTERLAGPRQRPGRARRVQYRFAPLALAGLNIVLFGLFFVWPGSLGLIYSFTDYTGIGTFEFIGLDNYEQLFGDPTFYRALTRTLLFAALSVPLMYVVSLSIAALLVSNYTRGKAAAKIIFFFPWLISPIVAGVIWRWMFGESFGFVNYVVSELGADPLAWQTDPDLALMVVVMAGTWGGTAFNMLIFIAALKNVPRAYYEAAEIDGANSWQRFRHITLPSIAPTSFLVILLSSLGAMKEFAMVQALNGGGPGTSNTFIIQYIYETGFQRADVGYASAVSMILLAILLTIALLQMWVNRRRAA